MTQHTLPSGSTDPLTTPFPLHPLRGPFNAAFFLLMGPVIERAVRRRKARTFADLRGDLLEIGPGVGANLPYLPAGGTVIAVEPNRHMHGRLLAAARRRGIHVELLERTADATGLPDDSVDAVISSLVLCSVTDVDAVLAEIQRVLRPGGTFRFLEHVVAPSGSLTRRAQRALRRPWGWTFEGCSCERDLERAIRGAGFASVNLERYRIHTPFVTFNPQIAGVAHV